MEEVLELGLGPTPRATCSLKKLRTNATENWFPLLKKQPCPKCVTTESPKWAEKQAAL